MAHVHINEVEVSIVAMFREKDLPYFRLNIFGNMINFTKVQLNELDARAAGCTLCNETVEECVQDIKVNGPPTRGWARILISKTNGEKLRRGEISLESVLFTKDK